MLIVASYILGNTQFFGHIPKLINFGCNTPSSEPLRTDLRILVESFINEALRHEGVWEYGCIDPHFLDLGTSWR
jgi:hypothetical protein